METKSSVPPASISCLLALGSDAAVSRSELGAAPLGENDDRRARMIVVMGVCGTGKTTLGKALAENLRLPFIDGDGLHPPANVAKMSRGEPLEDADRWTWLERIRGWAVECVGMQVRAGPGTRREPRRLGVVVACSALKKTYRAVLRGESAAAQDDASGSGSESALDTSFVYLTGERGVLRARMQNRKGHFMKAGMLESQLETLESPEGEEGVVMVSVETETEEQVKAVVQKLLS